ncbi:MAG: GGDEF domain-containing phosphodiesterase [Lachnospiraceae bacterium]|nr:GGDEF domain-containing phosphodiesterase [Lachnospiraceae bacterium]
MKNKKEKNYRRLTRNTAWIGFVVIFFAAICVHAILLAATAVFITYVFESKMASEYETIRGIKALYEQTDESKRNELFEDLDERGRIYYVTDDKGNVIHSNGEIVAYTEDNIVADYKNEGTVFYSNADISFIKSTADASGIINLFDVVKQISKSHDMSEMMNLRIDSEAEVFSIPVWVDMVLSDGESHFACMAKMVINTRDFVSWFIFFTLLSIITFTVSVVLFIHVILNAVRRRNTMNMVFKDPVTGGYNMNRFVFYGNRIIRKKKNRDRKYAVVSLKLVRYSYFCVCHSFKEGEQILVKVQQTLTKNILKNELCAHVSSSDFVLLLKYTDEEKIKKRVRHIIEQLEGVSDEHKFAFQAGIAVVDSSKTGDVNKRGRILMDIEKEYNYAIAAANTLAGSDESGVALLTDSLIEEQKWVDIVCEKQKQALENEEFVVYYQPKYDPKTDKLTGAEALIRWQSPEFGFVTPNRIIPIFEQNGFITEIDHYMIRHVARDQKKWLDAGYKCVPVSVNVSRAHFSEDDLAEQILELVDSEGAPHELIEIELTESAFFDDKKAMLSTIAKLKNYGFAVSMDDFGSGYSSLNSLKDMPLDVLKLDAEFFRGEDEDGRGKIVVTEAIKLAKSLNMRTVAEGVEIKDQVDFLATLGCDMIQGYYYAKPMPADEYVTRM